MAMLMLGGCGGGNLGPMPSGPSWSLADKTPASLGGASATDQASAATAASPYEYRGGRDPVTGRADGVQSPVPPIAPAAAQAAGAQGRSVVIRKGDTLHGLSLTHRVSVKALMAANNMKSTVIIPGKTLIIPAS